MSEIEEFGPSGEALSTGEPETFGARLRRWAVTSQTTEMGVRFHEDGTAEVLALFTGKPRQPRAAVLDVVWLDGRRRKSLGGRGLAALATGGLSLVASSTAGELGVTIVTDRWVHTVSSKQNLDKLFGLATQAKAITERRRSGDV